MCFARDMSSGLDMCYALDMPRGTPLPPKRGTKESFSFAPLSFAQRTFRTRVYERISNASLRAYIESSVARYIDDLAPSARDMCFARDMSSGLDMCCALDMPRGTPCPLNAA